MIKRILEVDILEETRVAVNMPNGQLDSPIGMAAVLAAVFTHVISAYPDEQQEEIQETFIQMMTDPDTFTLHCETQQ